MTSFKPEEMKRIQQGGNAVLEDLSFTPSLKANNTNAHRTTKKVARDYWLARWDQRDWPEPEAGDIGRIRDFIRMKYVEKRWINKGNASPQPHPGANTSYAARAQEPPPTGNSPLSLLCLLFLVPRSRHLLFCHPYHDLAVVSIEPLTKILGNNIPPIRVGSSVPSSAVRAPEV